MIEQLKTEQAVLDHINQTCESDEQVQRNLDEMIRLNNEIVKIQIKEINQ